MTVVDSRGRRSPAGAKGRTFSGPPPGSARARSTAPPRRQDPEEVSEFRAPSRRPGSLALWLFAAAICGVGVIVGARGNEANYHSVGIAYVIAAPLAAGLVRRGRDLTKLVCCLPLTFAVAVGAAGGVLLHQDSFPVTAKAVFQELGQQLVLHPAALWAGTVLAVIVGLRRGLGRRH